MQDEHAHPGADDDLIPDAPYAEDAPQFSRRDFLTGTSAVGAVVVASQWLAPLSRSLAAEDAPALGADGLPTGAETVPLTLRINGQTESLQIDPRTSLLDALRAHLHLTGSKQGCAHGLACF